MIDTLKWLLLCLGLAWGAGLGAFLAAALHLAARADREDEAR